MGNDLVPRRDALEPLNTRQDIDEIRRISGPGTGLSGWLGRIRVRGNAANVRVLRELVIEFEGLLTALDGLDKAKLERRRTIELLKDAQTVFEADAALRRKQWIDAQEAQREAEVRAEIRNMERERELLEARERHRQYMAARSGTGAPTSGQAARGSASNQAQQEFQADLDKELDTDRARMKLEEELNEYASRNGGWDNLTPEQKGTIERMRAAFEQLARESHRG